MGDFSSFFLLKGFEFPIKQNLLTMLHVITQYKNNVDLRLKDAIYNASKWRHLTSEFAFSQDLKSQI